MAGGGDYIAASGGPIRTFLRFAKPACMRHDIRPRPDGPTFEQDTDIKGSNSMDLGIKGKSALVCAGSKGLGKGCAFALAREGVTVTIVARGREALEMTANEMATGVKVDTVATDITTEAGRRKRSPPAPVSTSW
jgi:pyruvate/2-oxoglutarate dehydrogenase complex dihydrolipoamide dehydrogenase (E3) component